MKMKSKQKIIRQLLTTVLIIYPAFSSAYSEDPHHQFDMTHNSTDKVEITFRYATDITKACDAESKKRGLGGMPYSVDACSFWNWSHSECLIITPKTANFHTVGHEVRHCLQGNWHDINGEIKR
jgi:hypothetical protein